MARLRPTVINKLKRTPKCRKKLALTLNVSEGTVWYNLNKNHDNNSLTKTDALYCIQELLGVKETKQLLDMRSNNKQSLEICTDIPSFEDICADTKFEIIHGKEKPRSVILKHGWKKELAKLADCSSATVCGALYNGISGKKADRVRKLYKEKYSHIEIIPDEPEPRPDTKIDEVVKIEENSNNNLDGRLFTFTPSNQIIRVETVNGEPWFVAKDVCDILNHTNPSIAVQILDEDELAKKSLGRGNQTTGNDIAWFVNESGLYNLIFRSNKPEARVFRKWVTSEVLPALRKTGGYQIKKRSHRKPVPENSDIARLLQLIADNLQKNDKKAIAKQLGINPASVSQILSGTTRSNDILQALYEKALENKQNGFVSAYSSEFVTTAITKLK
ncbi:MAG: hypothetical protein LBL13_10360 [Bacteroidales bacterium]|jgi:prophage antirepressor-like protein|nr:hypothetical protein [Bacteroidales bacterium]